MISCSAATLVRWQILFRMLDCSQLVCQCTLPMTYYADCRTASCRRSTQS